MIEVILDALLDSLKILVFLILINILISFFEVKFASKIKKENKLSPLYASLFGIVPQCGISVVGTDLYLKRHITLGTLIALYLSCSDEALPILLGNFNEKSLYAIPLIIIKIIVGFIFGFLIDLLLNKNKSRVEEHLKDCHHEDEIHIGCCHHEIDHEESKIKEHIIHPLIHSLKLFIYILFINILFGFLIYFIGEDTLNHFLISNKYLAPLFATIIGLIPNCASSVIIVELFVLNNLSFGALVSGLLMNAGLGIVVLLKRSNKKETLFIIITNFIISILVGYLICLFTNF